MERRSNGKPEGEQGRAKENKKPFSDDKPDGKKKKKMKKTKVIRAGAKT